MQKEVENNSSTSYQITQTHCISSRHLFSASRLSSARSGSPCPRLPRQQNRFPHSGGQWSCMRGTRLSCKCDCVHRLQLLLLSTSLPLLLETKTQCCRHKLETLWCYWEHKDLEEMKEKGLILSFFFLSSNVTVQLWLSSLSAPALKLKVALWFPVHVSENGVTLIM